MNKERLEEIKKELELDCSNIFCVVNKDDIKWLINRIEELEEKRDEWKDTAQSYYMTNQELREQNKRYREALNNIYELAEYDEYNSILEQIVSEVEKALEGTE